MQIHTAVCFKGMMAWKAAASSLQYICIPHDICRLLLYAFYAEAMFLFIGFGSEGHTVLMGLLFLYWYFYADGNRKRYNQ